MLLSLSEYHTSVISAIGDSVFVHSGRITREPEEAWPPERPGGPLETPGLRGYKGPLKAPPPAEITRQIQYMIAT